MSLERFCRSALMTLGPGASLLDAARLMRQRHVGDVVIVERDHLGRPRVVGMVTDRDVALEAADGESLATKQVASTMARNVVTIERDESIWAATSLMRRHGIRRIPIVDASGAPCGIVTADDLYEMLSDELSNLASISDLQIAREVQRSAQQSGERVDLEPELH